MRAKRNRAKKPAPAYYFKGRPVFTQEQLETFDSCLPNENAWADELRRRAAAKGT